MKKLCVISLLLVICTISVKAQEYTSYDISKYYTPDIKRNKLDLEFGTNGRYNNDEFSSLKSSNIVGNLKADLNHYTHTRKRFSEFGVKINTDAYSNKNSSENYDSKNSSFEPVINLFTTNRFYNPSNMYFLIGGGGEFAFSRNVRKQEHFETNEKTEEIAKRQDITARAFIGGGKGRLESVEDARQAIYILENLSKRGVLSRRLTDEEIFTLSQLISSVKNKRFFDSRLHLIDEITRVDSFFVNNGLLTKSDAPYFTTLYDYWQNGALFERLSGTRFESYLSANHRRVKNDIDRPHNISLSQSQTNDENRVFWSNSIFYEKPINLYWQNSVSALLHMGYLWQNEDNSILGITGRKRENAFSTLVGSYAWAYYPNSRTRFSAWANQTVFLSKTIRTDNEQDSRYDKGAKFLSSTTSINGKLSYYISPQLRLSAHISTEIGYYKNMPPTTEYNNIEYLKKGISGGVTLTYSIY